MFWIQWLKLGSRVKLMEFEVTCEEQWRLRTSIDMFKHLTFPISSSCLHNPVEIDTYSQILACK